MPVVSSSSWRLALLLFAALETAMIWWRINNAPLAWICFVWIVVVVLLFFADRRPSGRILWLNLAAILAAIGLVEGALKASKARNPYLLPDGIRFVGDMARPNYFIQMPTVGLGYQPRPEMRILAVKKHNADTIYSVHYSVDSHGLRQSPIAMAEARGCVFMFGDSMAWGEGVDDEQTAAFQIGVLLGGAVKVSNFAFSGYSAHQMLWQVSSGMVAAVSGCDPSLPVLAIYQTLPNNVGRVAGLRGWDEFGPRYLLGSDDEVHYAGSFARGDYVLHDRLFIPSPLANQFGRVNLYSRIWGRDRSLDAFDYARFSALVKTAALRLRSRYPRLQFLVVVWPEPPGSNSEPGSPTSLLVHDLQWRGVTTVSINDIIPEYRSDPAAMGIPGDGHPNAAAQRMIANYFAPRVHRLIAGDRQP